VTGSAAASLEAKLTEIADGLFRVSRDYVVEVKGSESEKESSGSERRWWG
jgi:hypothetical protein